MSRFIWDDTPSIQHKRREAREALADLTITPEERVRKVVRMFPGGSITNGPSEFVEATRIARELQRMSVINCGACYRPEDCIANKRCRRV